MRRVFLLLICLSDLALGTPTSLDRTSVLWTVPGVVGARAVPDAQLRHSNYTHTLTVRSLTTPVRVNLTAASTEAVSAVNNVLMWVGAPHADRDQKTVLVRVARTYLQRCMAGVTPGQLGSVSALTGVDWQSEHGWQSRQLGQLKLEWGEGEGLAIGGKNRSGLTLSWPAGAARCAF